MVLYAGIDLHANHSVGSIIDEQDHRVYQKRLRTELPEMLQALAPYQAALQGVVVESTYNWYWLVDGLLEAGYRVHLANTAALQQYEGLQYTADHSAARGLAHLLRLGILPPGYIDPVAERAVRDLLRKRSQLVRQKTANRLSIENGLTRNPGLTFSGNRSKQRSEGEGEQGLPVSEIALAVKSTLAVLGCLEEQIESVERAVLERAKGKEVFQSLLTVRGSGHSLGLTILRETGTVDRFARGGQFAAYCRCVGRQKLRNGKRKGEGNTKNGNKYLAWAVVEAANFALRYNPRIRRFYQRKQAKTNGVVALKAVAHKWARAGYYGMRDQGPFAVNKAFA